MRVVEEGNNTWISPKDNYGKIPNQQIFIYARSGWNKGLTEEGLVEWYQRHGYVCIICADPKFESEFLYQQFLPEEKYHLDHLKLASSLVGEWKLPKEHKVKAYHPFSFNIPTDRKLPGYNFFTIPLKSLGRKEWGMLAEVHGENETISLLLRASEEINDEEGIYSFAHHAQDSVSKTEKKRKVNWKNFGLEASSGTAKELMKIGNILRPFKKHYFLGKQNSPYNLDWKNILTDQQHYHVFVSNFIGRGEEKVCDFLILYLLESILRNKQYLKNPLLIVLPEVSKLCPFHPEGHKQFLSEAITADLKTMRSEGRGISSILDSQVFGNVSEDLRGSSTINLFGELGDIKDIENLCKALGYGKDVKSQLDQAEIPRTYLTRGIQGTKADEGGYLFFYPTAMHCEENYNFEEMYRKHSRENPEKYPMKSYKDLVDEMKKQLKQEEEEMKKKVKKRERELELLEQKKIEERESKKEETSTIETQKEKIKQTEDRNKLTLMKLCYEMFHDETLDKKERTFRKIAIKLGIKTHNTVSDYIKKYSKKIESEDFSDKVVEEIKKE